MTTNRRAALKSLAALPLAALTGSCAAPALASSASAAPDPVWRAIDLWQEARIALDAEMARIKGTGEDLDDELSSDELDRATDLIATPPTTLEGLFALILTLQRLDSWTLDDHHMNRTLVLSLSQGVANVRGLA
ncbi:hypothetical protein; putative secreted protein [Bradyrhizobium sp. ORS 278]|uniref:hypothetical protein n=1 Tax=Bradyrhizobium sp. (strain ORS 278) TaxID=114615 RepID=UPI0001507849|nr:hypothetical protein [Bradyrhizobium sp. ORS 278]CAL74424.1 hypothetical protein; putative secreted protein [Bradyrhizobium sp. ORS 278]